MSDSKPQQPTESMSAEHWRTQEHTKRFGEGHARHGSSTQAPSHMNCNWTGEEVEAYAALQVKEVTAKLREERDALEQQFNEAVSEQGVLYQKIARAESALAEVVEDRRLTLNKFATLESALAEARKDANDKAEEISRLLALKSKP